MQTICVTLLLWESSAVRPVQRRPRHSVNPPPHFQQVKLNRLVSFFPPFSIWLFHLCCRPSGTFVIPSCSGILENQFLPWQIPFSGGSNDQRRRVQIDALWFALFELCRRNTVLTAPVFIYAAWVAGLRCSDNKLDLPYGPSYESKLAPLQLGPFSLWAYTCQSRTHTHT